jgi:hypothetical protein
MAVPPDDAELGIERDQGAIERMTVGCILHR